MKNKLIVKSKRSITNTVSILLGIILFSFFIHLIDVNFQPKNEYDKNWKLFGFIVLPLLILYFIYYLFSRKRIFVYQNYFEIKGLFKTQKYNYSEIATHFSEHFEGKYNSWNEYYLMLKNGEKIKFIDSEYSNFQDFYSKIEKRTKVDEELNANLQKPSFLKYAVISSFIGALLFNFSSFYYDFKEIENKDFVYFRNELKSNITIVRESKGKKHFKIHLAEYPNFEFHISGQNYDAIPDDDEFLNKFTSGDVVTIGLSKDEYDKKILKTKELNFLDKYRSYSVISVQQIMKSENNPLIDIEKVNESHLESNYVGIGLFSFFGLVSFYLAYGNYKAYRNSLK